MLVFSDQKDLEEINEERIIQHFEDKDKEKMQRKQETYRNMANRQIEEVLAQIMSMSDFNDQRYSICEAVSEGRSTMLSHDISHHSDEELNDSQDKKEYDDDEDNDQILQDNYVNFMKNYSSGINCTLDNKRYP